MGDTPSGSQNPGKSPNISCPSQLDLSQDSTVNSHVDGEVKEGQPGSYSQTNYPSHQLASRNSIPTRTDSFDMNQLGTALPDMSHQQSYIMQQQQQQRYPPAYSPVGHNYQQQQQHPSQFPNVQGINSSGNVNYSPPYQNQYQASYAPSHTPSPPHLQPGSASADQFYQNQLYMSHLQQQQQHLQASQYFTQPGQYSPQNQMYPGMQQTGHLGARSNSFPIINRQQVPQQSYGYLGVGSGGVGPARPSKSMTQSSVVRGPPRKPRQSGHAIWIGNLPPQTELMNLVHHVCKEAPGLESLFLISKSNCAFANFKDEATCAEAQGKIHDSRFQTVRLVSRLRRSSVGGPGGVAIPTGPAALTSPTNPPVVKSPSQDAERCAKETVVTDGELRENISAQEAALLKDKFFIVKSLTVEDLELSVRNGIWATQSHNEQTLNRAYQTADNVYLVFSANKSGEYFGYGRMISPINDDPAAAIEFAPKAQAVEDPELPKAIPTEATEFAPKGRIIDDSARGTIFWEAERDDEDEADETDSNKSEDEISESKAWGKPFKIEWVSTTRLPFYRTRGLRNPWNQNREVKIARDGTELETTIGRRLTALFHRVPSPDTQAPPQMLPMAGYPPQQQFN